MLFLGVLCVHHIAQNLDIVEYKKFRVQRVWAASSIASNTDVIFALSVHSFVLKSCFSKVQDQKLQN